MAVLNTTTLIEIYIDCDDFCKKLHPYELAQNCSQTTLNPSQGGLSTAEMMSIVIFYHHSGIRCFSWYYQAVLQKHFTSFFPDLCSYNRFIQKMHRLFFPLYALLLATRLSVATEGNYIDATKLVVCHNKRIPGHRKGFASRGKSSTGWFLGFKLHAIINQWPISPLEVSQTTIKICSEPLLNGLKDSSMVTKAISQLSEKNSGKKECT